MKLSASIGTSILVSTLLLSVVACQKEEGPAERAGKQVDQAVDTAGKNIEKAGQNIQDAAKDEKK